MNLCRRLLACRRITRSVLPLVAAALFLMSLPLIGGLRPAGATGGANIAFFYDSAYVDTAAGGGGEAYNLRATLTAQGNTVTTFTGTSGTAWSAALAGKDVVVIPELQNGDLNAGLASDAKTALRNFVQGGGGLISTMDSGTAGTRMVNLLNTIYGYSLAFGSVSNSTASLNTVAAAGTPYAGGPATIPRQSAVGGVVASTLPSNAKNIYVSDSNTRVWVTYFAEGSGQIALLGWDWFNAQPTGTQDGGWLSVLSRSIDQIASAGLAATVSSSSVVAGSTGSATVSVTNSGSADATSVALTGSVPSTLAVTGVSSSQGTCTTAQAYTCSVGTLTPSQTVTVTVDFSVAASTAASTVNHSVHVTSAEGPTADAQGAATITESNAFSLSAGAGSAPAGGSDHVNVVVTNNGPSNADTTTLTGTVPSAAAVTSVSSTQGTCSGTQSYSCSVGTLAPGASATVTVAFSVAPSATAQTVQHSAHATSAEGATADASGSIVIGTQNALTVASGGASVVAGRTGTFTVEVTNHGPSNANTTTLTGTVPSAAAVSEVSSTQGTCSGTQSFTCGLGTLAPDASATITVAFSTDPSTAAQTLHPSLHATSAEGAASDGQGTVDIRKENTLTVTAGDASASAGRSATFTVAVTNHGPSDADTTSLAGAVPQAATVTEVSSTKGSCQTAQSYRCSVGTLSPGGTATVTVRFSVSPSTSAQTLRHTAEATSAAGASTTATGAVEVKKSNGLGLTATGASVVAGDSGRITFEVANTGPSDAGGTAVAGSLPDALAVTAVSSTAGSCTAGQAYTCEVGALHAGDSATVSVQFSVSPTATATTLSPAVHATTVEGATADAQAAVTVSQLAPPGASYGSKVDNTETTATANPGGQVTVSGSGFRPGSDVEVWLHSTPIFLGVTQADDHGAFTATYRIPASAETGSHHIVLEGIGVNGAETSVTLNLDVQPKLPTTGGVGLLRIGLLITLAGAMILAAAGRKKTA